MAGGLGGLCGVIVAIDVALLMSVLGSDAETPGKELRKVWVGILVNLFEAIVALSMWEVISGNTANAYVWVLSLAPITVTGLALVHAFQLVTLRVAATWPSIDSDLQRWVIRILVYLQRSLMALVAVVVAYSDLAARNLVDPGRPLWHFPVIVSVVLAPVLVARSLEAVIRHHLEECPDSWLSSWYSRVRSLYWLPAVACAGFTAALLAGFGDLVAGKGSQMQIGATFGHVPVRTALVVLGVCFSLLELNMSIAIMAKIYKRRPGLVPTQVLQTGQVPASSPSTSDIDERQTGPEAHPAACEPRCECLSRDGSCSNLDHFEDGETFRPVGITMIVTLNTVYFFTDEGMVRRMPRTESPRPALPLKNWRLEDGDWVPYSTAVWVRGEDRPLRLAFRVGRRAEDEPILTTPVVALRPG
jgi:hypothetical protein